MKTVIHNASKRILGIFGVLLIAFALTGLVYAHKTTPQSGFTAPISNKVFYGVQLDWETDSIEEYSSRLGRYPSLYGIYANFPLETSMENFISSNLKQLAIHKGSIMLTLEPWGGLDIVNDESLTRLTSVLQEWNRLGVPVLVRFAHEMNGAWYPWAQQPTEYIDAFRRVADAVHEAPQSSTLWSPNEAGGYPYSGGKYEAKPSSSDYRILDTNGDGVISMNDDPYAPFYPGDSYVDWVGMSVYHFGVSWPWGRNTVPEDGKLIAKITGNYINSEVNETSLPNFYSIYAKEHGKPFAISETSALYVDRKNNGAKNSDIKKAWMKQVLDPGLKKDFPKLGLIVWFEYQKEERSTAPSPVDWTVTTDTTTLNEYQNLLPNWLQFGR